MDLEARKYEFIQKLSYVNETLLDQLEAVLNKGINEHQRISIEQYNKEIEDSIADIETGDYHTQDEVKEMIQQWGRK